jgi:hypothetical protein
MTERTIIQIIPAVGWKSIYRDDDDLQNPMYEFLVCWALIEDEHGERHVVGMDGNDYVGFCDEMSNFQGYMHEQPA